MYLDTQIKVLIDLHNDARVSKWLWKAKPLVENSKLSYYAQRWANKMASKDRLYHSSMQDILSMGFSMAAENIAYGQKTPEEVMKSWLSSNGHKRNIMNSSLTDIGCGISISKNGKMFWCVCFART